MAQLTADAPRDMQLRADDFFTRKAIGVDAAADVYAGSAIGLNAATELGRQLVAGDPFLGFARSQALNGSGAAGDLSLDLIKRGVLTDVTIVGLVAGTDVGTKIYMSDGDVFTLTSAANSYIGKLARNDAGSVGDVNFQADDTRQGDT